MKLPLVGVNLGGWLVLEPWITPSLFANTQAADEYNLCRQPHAHRAITAFRNQFITEADIAWLAQHKVEAVRLPIGYWLFGNERPYLSTVQYVDQLFSWAEHHHLKVLLSLHGAPGSQNGKMHSGRAGAVLWAEPEQQARSLEVLKRLAKRYGHHPALLGISVINEPDIAIALPLLRAFYEQAYTMLRPAIASDAWIIASDGFRARHMRGWFGQPQHFIDYHHYQLFSWIDGWLPAGWQVWRARHLLPRRIKAMARQPLVIGEWSMALPARRLHRLSSERQQQLVMAYGQAQQTAFMPAAAQFFWTYKTESPNSWNFRHLIEAKQLNL